MSQGRSRGDLLFPHAEDETYVGVALDVPVDRLFTYRVPPELEERAQPGHRVVVPFRNRPRDGFVVERQGKPDLDTRILAVRDLPDEHPVLDAGLLELGRFVARYYGSSLGEALSAMVPRGVRRRGKGRTRYRARLVEGAELPEASEDEPTPGPRTRVLRLLRRHPEGFPLADLCRRAHTSPSPVHTLAKKGLVLLEKERALDDELLEAAKAAPPPDTPPELTPEQSHAVRTVTDASEAGTFAPHLLLGVTGSGKTEVYLRAIEACIASSRQAIVLVPEIALTPQTVRRFRARFERVSVLHSAMTEAERARAWRKIRRGESDIVIGPRSAIFAPVPALGLLVVDEEHEGSFKQQNSPRYHARDLGMVRAKTAGAVVILGTATPALETWHNANEGRYTLLRLPERVGGRPMPTVQIVDTRDPEEKPRRAGRIGRTLEVRIREALRGGSQVMLLQNRRGFATSVACPRCGWVLVCTYCDVSLTYHKHDTISMCHLCGHEKRPPRACPDCALPMLRMQGAGTQTVEEELGIVFPEARVARMDSDTMATRESYEEVLGRFERREIDILVGTQMIAKGLHFPHVTLVGIVSADTSLVIPDFRSAERTFSLVSQVSGRAGRGDESGRVVVQTSMPDHPAIRFAAAHDYDGFATAELADRKEHGYPPFQRLLRVVTRGPVATAVEERARETARRLLDSLEGRARVLGPAEPTIARVGGLWRRHILVKAPSHREIARALGALRSHERPRGSVEEMWDVDPIGVL